MTSVDRKSSLKKDAPIFLFSLDLEDVRAGLADGERYCDRVEPNTRRYLQWLKMHNAQCTFFVVGEIARRYPELIRAIVADGHEVASHSDQHIPLTSMTPEQFKRDLSASLDAISRAGATNVKGFRAPIFSLVRRTQWAYPILREFGLTYSSSVLPAKNPLHGWEGFSESPIMTDSGVYEIPMTLGQFGPLKIPVGGGVYFRAMPMPWINSQFRAARGQALPILGYFHPYDIDSEQERFMHPGINNSRFFNFLMYCNRRSVFSRLDRVMNSGFRIVPYREFVASALARGDT